jgi:branched-chain amino acid transport system permease protein
MTLPHRRWPLWAAGLLIILILPVILNLLGNYYAVRVIGLVGIYCILGVGLNITIGYTGLFDLGYIAFYAIGAYTAALLNIAGISFWPGLPIVILVGGLVRLGLGAPVLRLRGDYLAIVTLGFGEIVRLVLINLEGITNGPKGLPRVNEKLSDVQFFTFKLTENIHFYYLILFFLFITILISYRLERSRLGRALVAIREDELAATLSGVNIARTKAVAFVISGMIGAVAGSIYVHWNQFVSPESFTFMESVMLVSMLVIGGIGNIAGVLLGVLLLVAIPEILRSSLGSSFVDYRYIAFGLLMVVAIIFRPQGILPSKRSALELKAANEGP